VPPARFWIVAIALAGCDPSIGAAPPNVPATAKTGAPTPKATRETAEQRAEQGSRLRAGDYVVYAYSGSYSKLPVTLRERVLAQDGLRLTIEVAAQRGDEQKRWLQVVTDTPENREKNLVDELYELAGADRQHLPNADNADLMRLYAWTLPPCKGKHEHAGKVDVELPVAGVRFKCTCTSILRECSGKPAQIETCDCPDFVWRHASGEARPLDDAEVLWRTEVKEFGNARD
jgi:hypothetical protein